MHNVSQEAPAYFLQVNTSFDLMVWSKKAEDGASVIRSVLKVVPRRTEQAWRTTFIPPRLSYDSNSRLIKMSEAIQLIKGRDKTLPMFSSRGDSEAVHTFLGLRIQGRKDWRPNPPALMNVFTPFVFALSLI